jgi:hypothetical protein
MRNVHRALLALIATAATCAAQSPGGWTSVQALSSGTEVRLAIAKSNAVSGKLESATDNSLTINPGGSPQSFQRQQITRVLVKTEARRKRSTWIGLSVGAGSAAAIEGAIALSCGGFCTDARTSHKAAFIGGGIALGAAVGALFGAALSRGGWREIYRQ